MAQGDNSNVSDITNPEYLTRPALGQRSARILSGRGMFSPGYRLVGEGKFAPSEDYGDVNIVKMVSPLTGQQPAENKLFYRRDASTLPVRVVRASRAVAPNTGTNVVRPPRNAIRRMNNSGQGTVGYA